MFQISIHTPTRGVTTGDPRMIRALAISIHTPTRGVTMAAAAGPRPIYDFNPHTHAGCDNSATGDSYAMGGFQSTHPRGV